MLVVFLAGSKTLDFAGLLASLLLTLRHFYANCEHHFS